MRHLRMLGICMAAILAVSGIAASGALAKKSREANVWEKFNECPWNAEPFEPGDSSDDSCVYGEAGPESFFQAGKVTVHFKKPVILRGGLEETAEGHFQWIGARYGDTISPEAEPAPSLTEGVDAELLPPAEKARYEAYLAGGGKTKVTATIELAKAPTSIILKEGNLIEENNAPAFIFPVEIHLSNKFLGTHCYVGNYQEPVIVPFTTGETAPEPPNTPIHGHAGELHFSEEGTYLELRGVRLVNNEYAAPGVQGCGVNSEADAAINAALGLPSPAGSNTTELIGNLFEANAKSAQEHDNLSRRR